MGHNKYRIKVDGSGRVTDRNRHFLHQFTQVTPVQPGQRPDNSYAPKQVVDPAPEPDPRDHQPVQPDPDINQELQVPSTPEPVVPTQPTSPTSPESPSFVTPPTTPVTVIPPQRSTRVNHGKPPERLTNYSLYL